MKIIKIYEDKGHVEFDCGDGVVQKTQDQFDTVADNIKVKVANYCELYTKSLPEAIPAVEVTKMRAIENKAFTVEDVKAVEEVVKE